ncbi:MAG: hypothetical protein JW958_02135 [Candidatus Eisenbacteria bacterium]|nr:hypothetical protein [Candidatus Eisenbacteria bacterium]
MSREKKGRSRARTTLPPILAGGGILLLLLFFLRTGGAGRTDTVRIPISPVGPVDGPVRELVWRRQAGASRFTVDLFGSGGGRIWSGVSRDTTILLPEGIPLEEGSVYRWRVTAHFPDGVSQAAPDETFHIRPGTER